MTDQTPATEAELDTYLDSISVMTAGRLREKWPASVRVIEAEARAPLRRAVEAFYSTSHPATMDEATGLPVWRVSDHDYGELRRAVAAIDDPTQRRPGEAER